MVHAHNNATYELMIKLGTVSGKTWHHPRAIGTWLDNRRSSRSCNRVNLVKTLRSDLDVSS